LISSSFGTTTERSWRIIDALMYGDNPMRIIENLSRLPPINELKNARPGCAAKTLLILARESVETPGTGITERSL
jgi:hypothetical protein